MNRKFLLFCIFSYLLTSNMFSQEKVNYWEIDSLDTFNEATMPLSDGLTMWLTRQNLELNGTWFSLKSEAPFNGDNYRLHTEIFLPVYASGKISSTIGATYNKSYLLSSATDIDKNYQYNWLFGAVQYTSGRWRLQASAEYNINGNENSFFKVQGNRFMPLATVGYALNKNWEVFVIGGYNLIYKENIKTEEPLIAAQVRYNPSPKFKIVFGAPVVFACEWSVTSKLDFFCRYMIYNETQTYIRYMFSKSVGLSIEYNNTHNKTYEAYFNTKQYTENNNSVDYNNARQLIQPLSLSLILNTRKNFAINILAGYNMGDDIDLYHDDNKVATLSGENEFFFGLQINYLVFH